MSAVMQKTIKQRRCKAPGCNVLYTPYSTLSRACSGKCALALVLIAKAKNWKKEKKERKNKLKTMSDWTKDAQKMFNKFIRLRDKDLSCISCGWHHRGQYHAGHYKGVKAFPELRFNENNCHKQCSSCNNFLSGNLIKYRIALVEKIGLDSVVELEGNHEAKHYIIQDVKDIREYYRLKIKEMEKQ